jgi:hypothetical protein
MRIVRAPQYLRHFTAEFEWRDSDAAAA